MTKVEFGFDLDTGPIPAITVDGASLDTVLERFNGENQERKQLLGDLAIDGAEVAVADIVVEEIERKYPEPSQIGLGRARALAPSCAGREITGMIDDRYSPSLVGVVRAKLAHPSSQSSGNGNRTIAVTAPGGVSCERVRIGERKVDFLPPNAGSQPLRVINPRKPRKVKY